MSVSYINQSGTALAEFLSILLTGDDRRDVSVGRRRTGDDLCLA
jgi:hypothetical protein